MKVMGRVKWAAWLGAFGIVGCGEQATETQTPEAEWQQLDDGSKFAHARSESIDEAARCWRKDQGFICLSVQSIDLGSVGRQYVVRAAERPALGEASSPGIGEIDGYVCNYLSSVGASEEIIRGADRLVSRKVGAEVRWPKSYVDGYLADNGLPGRHFDCIDVLNVVRSGTLETLSTTAITQSMLPK